MPCPYPKEFREDVVAVALRREGGVTTKQIATDFEISEATLQMLAMMGATMSKWATVLARPRRTRPRRES